MKWISCTESQLKEFVEDNKLTYHPDGMGAYWTNAAGEELAREAHGFFSQMYSIFTSENMETLMVVGSIIDKYANKRI